MATHFHVLITSVSFSLSPHMPTPSQYRFSYVLACVCQSCPWSHFFNPGLLNPFYTPIIHRDILFSVLSSMFCSAVLSAHVSLPSVRTYLSDGCIIYCYLSIASILLSCPATFPNQLPLGCLASSSQPPFSLITKPRYLNCSTCFSLSFFLSDTSGDVTGSTSQRRHLVIRHDIW